MNFDEIITGQEAFKLFATYGFPIELTVELANEKGAKVDLETYNEEFKKHQEISKQGAEQRFKGGLADSSIESTRLHTATHLLHQALKTVLGDDVNQKGSNITPDRLRFDFNYPDKMTDEQKAEVEKIVNDAITADYPISFEEMTVPQAKEGGAIGLFEDKYEDKVKVYKIGDFSMEICGGPHVQSTGELKGFKIQKEESCGAGVRRIKAQVDANVDEKSHS
jgi:alanyl-tRNA synthetase